MCFIRCVGLAVSSCQVIGQKDASEDAYSRDYLQKDQDEEHFMSFVSK